MRFLIAAVALVLAAAAAPAAAQSLLRLDAESNGQAVSVAPGQTIVVALDVIGPESAAGPAWAVAQRPACVEQTGELIAVAEIESANRAVARTFMFRFSAVSAGSGDIVIEQRAHGAGRDSAPLATYRLRVEVSG